MNRRRLDKLEGSLSPSEAVLLWLGAAHTFGTLPAYVASLIDQPDTAQPFIALPSQVSKSVWASMRGERTAAIKAATNEAVGDTVFLLRLVIDLNVHIEETLRLEQLRHAALYWWSRSLDPDRRAKTAPPPQWTAAVATLVGTVRRSEEARREAEHRYLERHDLVFSELAAEWRDLHEAVAAIASTDRPDAEASAHELATQRVRQLIRMARADVLDAVGLATDADALAHRVAEAIDHQEATP